MAGIKARTGFFLVVGILATVATAVGETPVVVAPDAHAALNAALDSQRRGDYQQAADLAQAAAAGQSSLTSSERQTLARLTKDNTAALAARRSGAEQLQLALGALRNNHPGDAIDFFKQVAAKESYLTAADRQTFKPYAEGMHLGAALSPYQRTPGPLFDPSVSDPAPQVQVRSPYHVIVNNLDSVKKTPEIAPKRLEPVAPALSPAPAPALPYAYAGLEKPKATVPTTAVLASDPAPSKEAKSYASLEKPKATAPTTAVLASDPAPAKEAKSAALPKDTEAARVLLAQARKAIEAGDLALARRQIALARALRPDFLWYEDNPARLEAEAARVEMRKKPNAAPVVVNDKDMSPTEPKAKAAALLKTGRSQLNDNKLDEAMQTAGRLRTIQGVAWGAFEDSPERLIQDIYAAYQKRDQEESVKVLAEARQRLQQGDLDGAERIAYRAQTLHGPYSSWDFGDRPDRVLAEVGTARARRLNPPETQAVAASGQAANLGKASFQPPPFLPPVGVASASAIVDAPIPCDWSATLKQARLELSRGATDAARKLAESVYTSAHTAGVEAEVLLRSIDEEEFAQLCLRDQHTFDAASAAYSRGEVAEASRLLRTIDARRLDPARAARLREMTVKPGASMKP